MPDPDSAITLRPVVADDLEFLYRLYASTRLDELAAVGWDAAQTEAFLRGQFQAQHRHYTAEYVDATYDLVLVDGVPRGRLYLAQWPTETRVIDISLLPGTRGRGVGTRLMADVLADAEDRGACVTAHVDKQNRALAWYLRLGFVVAEDRGANLFIRRTP